MCRGVVRSWPRGRFGDPPQLSLLYDGTSVWWGVFWQLQGLRWRWEEKDCVCSFVTRLQRVLVVPSLLSRLVLHRLPPYSDGRFLSSRCQSLCRNVFITYPLCFSFPREAILHAPSFKVVPLFFLICRYCWFLPQCRRDPDLIYLNSSDY